MERDNTFIAHIKNEKEIQSVIDHCEGTARITKENLRNCGLEKTGEFIGRLHDIGKMKLSFNDYIIRANNGEKVIRGSVNHTFASVRLLLEEFHDRVDGDEWDSVVSEILAYTVGAHHGLFDSMDEHRKCGFEYRKCKEDIGYEECLKNFYSSYLSRDELGNGYEAAKSELVQVLNKIFVLGERENEGKDVEEREVTESCFYMGMLIRLLLSALVDGDRTDTAEFMFGKKLRKEYGDNVWSKVLEHMENKLAELKQDNLICQARQIISEKCREFAERPGGIYRLNVPTGGGKTLSSLRYALAHAEKFQKEHIIFTSPLLSILDQNSSVICDYVGNKDIILEHHSDIIKDVEGKTEEELKEEELLYDSWDAPIIITTLVQLLNTMFSGKMSCIRRFHSLSNSVIVIDEVQTVPIRMLTLFNMTLNFLSEVCGTTIILCSATQPALYNTKHALLGQPIEIVPYDEELWKIFERTKIVDKGSMGLDEVEKFARKKYIETNSLLIVCNKTDEASELYWRLKECSENVLYISAKMCREHRKKAIKELLRLTEDQQPVICVSTQILEAGVDISFRCVIRLSAGMDSVVQSAGRCNRNNEMSSIAEVYLIDLINENLRNLKDIQAGKDATGSLCENFKNAPEYFDENLASEKAIDFYYKALYGEYGDGYDEFYIGQGKNIYELLSDNSNYHAKCEAGEKYVLSQAFREAGEAFYVIDSTTQAVLVYYDESESIIAELCSEKAINDIRYRKDYIDKAKPYVVNLYSYEINALIEADGIMKICENSIWVLKKEYYDEHVGFCKEAKLSDYMEV